MRIKQKREFKTERELYSKQKVMKKEEEDDAWHAKERNG